MRTDEELLKEIESDDFDPTVGTTYTKQEDMSLALAVIEYRAAENKVTQAVQKARTSGTTWETIGKILGISRQGAQQRYKDA